MAEPVTMPWGRSSREDRVIEGRGGVLVHESGQALPNSFYSPRVAIAAHFGTQPKVSKSFRTLVGALAEHGYHVIVVSTSEFPQPLDWGERLPDRLSVYRRANFGYDFGSWAVALNTFPKIASAPRVVLTNDSLVGPFRSIAPELDFFDRMPVDVWSLVRSEQMFPHLQSFFLGFRDGVLTERRLRRFWSGVQVQEGKHQVVLAYEVGLSQLLRERDLVSSSLHPWREHRRRDNPTTNGWRTLLDEDFPFVKRMLVAKDVYVHEDLRVERQAVAAAVMHRYQEDLLTWL